MESIPAVGHAMPKKATKVLYRANNIQTNSNIFWSINADGTNKRAIKLEVPSPFLLRYYQSGLMTSDRKQLIFMAELEDSDCCYIYKWGITSGDMQQLIGPINYSVGLTAIVGDATIYYWKMSNEQDFTTELWKVGMDSSNHKKVDLKIPGRPNLTIIGTGKISPDGKSIIYIAENVKTRQQSIYKSDLSGAHPTLLIDLPPNEEASIEAITEQGTILMRKIILEPLPEKNAKYIGMSLWSINLDGSNQQKIDLQLPDQIALKIHNSVKTINGKLYISAYHNHLLKNTLFSSNLDGSDLQPITSSNQDIALMGVY